jgi:hypothetical protein
MLRWGVIVILFCARGLMAHVPEDPRTSELLALQKKYRAAQQKLINLQSDLIDLDRAFVDGVFRYLDIQSVFEGRLTSISNTPVPTSDTTNVGTLYLTPYTGSVVALYSGTSWELYRFTQINLNVSGLSNNKNFDVFLYNNAGTLTLEFSAAWASDTARTDAISLQDGVYVKTSATTRRYVGTVRATNPNRVQDTATQRYVWNYRNRVPRRMNVADTANSWTYNANTWRSTDNSTANRVEFVVGINESLLHARAMLMGQCASAGNYFATGFGLDSTTTDSSNLHGGAAYGGSFPTTITQTWADYKAYPGIGYHYLQWLERGNTATVTFYGDNGDATKYSSAMIVEWEG